MEYKATLCGKVIGKSGRLLKLVKKPNGYLHFSKSTGGAPNQTLVHRFVYEYFKGPIPKGLVIDHIDGDRHNNRVDNLRAVTVRQNTMFGRAGKLNEEDVSSIKALLGTKSQRQIAKDFGVSEQLICDIKKGRKHD